MKRLFAAAVLAAAVVPATQAGAVPPETAGGPLGWGTACLVVGNPDLAPATCRFTGAADSVGYAGGSSGTVTLSHKEKVAVCNATAHVYEAKINTVVDDSAGAAPEYLGSQGGLTPGVVYTLTVDGPGFAMAGGPSTPAAAPPAEPADTPVDRTNGKVGTVC